MHDAVVVEARSRLIVEVLVLRYVLGALVEKSRIQNDVRHELNHLLLLQLRCNYGTEINLHWSGPRTLLASTLSLHRFFSLSGARAFSSSRCLFFDFTQRFLTFWLVALRLSNPSLKVPIGTFARLTNKRATLDLPRYRQRRLTVSLI